MHPFLLRIGLLALLVSGVGCETSPAPDESQRPDVRIVETREVESLHASMGPDVPKVDIGVYVPQTDDERYNQRVPMEILLERLAYAKTIFAGVGVDLNVMWIKTFTVPDTSWLTIQSSELLYPPEGTYPMLYDKMEAQQSTLAPEAERLFEALIEPDPHNDRTVYLIGLRDVSMSFYEQDETGEWVLYNEPVNALSLPPYILEDRIPKRLRGAITMQNLFISQKVIAHELGHKLINVSHEYGLLDPQHEIDAEGGLMVYGEGIDIPSGKEGRWHLERLHRSPFLYRLDADGERLYNPDYHEHGRYADPLYGEYVMTR